jgi:hypothetical protein
VRPVRYPGPVSTTEALLPPKANEFVTTTEGLASRPVSGTMSRPEWSCTPRVLMVGGSMPRSIARTLQTASTAPAAPRVCPTTDFVELAGGTESAPKSSLRAFGSTASLVGVPVPCRLM